MNAQVVESLKGIDAVITVQGGEHDMAGLGRANCLQRGLLVADLPTRITSGSWRTNERMASAKLKPISGRTRVCWILSMEYSMGSSTVMTLRRPSSASSCSPAYNVVDLPEPVGPTTSTSPAGLSSNRWYLRASLRTYPAPAWSWPGLSDGAAGSPRVRHAKRAGSAPADQS